MSDPELTLRLLDAVAQGAEEKRLIHGEESAMSPATPKLETSVTSRQMLEALIATDFDLPSAIVRVARGD